MTRKKPKGIRHPPQRRGRALKTGARYPSGKLKVAQPVDDSQPGPEVIRIRRHMLGKPNATPAELRAAENPLDLALARQWITPQEHAAGVLLAGSYLRSGIGLPKLRTQDLAREIRGGQEASGDPRAMDALRQCARALHGWPKCTAAMIDVCVLGEWPAWALARINGTPRQEYEVGWVHLRTGLRIVGRVFGCGEAVEEQQRMAG